VIFGAGSTGAMVTATGGISSAVSRRQLSAIAALATILDSGSFPTLTTCHSDDRCTMIMIMMLDDVFRRSFRLK
jgi:hypothetical protein